MKFNFTAITQYLMILALTIAQFVNFTPDQINENATALLQTLAKLKPSSAKGVYFNSISMASTMSPGINIDYKTVSGI